VLVGFGRVGHRVGEILSVAGLSFVGLDFDSSVVEKERAKGRPVFFGDVRKPGLLEAAGAKNASIIIVTLNDPEATEQVLISLRKTHPQVPVYVRGQSLVQCRTLRKLGATGAVSENVEASLELASMALRNTGVSEQKREAIIENFRQTYHSQIDN
jgi:voltage-gated potassium channel Kch